MRDRDRYATGWAFTDWLTAPYWTVITWLTKLRVDRLLGIGGLWWTRRAKRRALWRAVGWIGSDRRRS